MCILIFNTFFAVVCYTVSIVPSVTLVPFYKGTIIIPNNIVLNLIFVNVDKSMVIRFLKRC
jgi:hypothetical protein